MENLKKSSEQSLVVVSEQVESLNVADLDIETLESRLEMATLFGTSCYLNSTCSLNCSSNMGDGL